MLTLPFFMLETWNFHQRPLAWSILKHSGQKNFKLTFGHLWPLCNIQNAIFAIFQARQLKFSPQTPCLLFFKKQWSISFQSFFHQFWPLCNIKMLTWPFFMLDNWNFHHRPPCLLFFKNSGQIFFKLTHDYFWTMCNIINANVPLFMLKSLNSHPTMHSIRFIFIWGLESRNWLRVVFEISLWLHAV